MDFDRKIPLSTDNVDKVIQACCCLHKYLTEDKDIDHIFAELNPNGSSYLDQQGVVCLYLPTLHGYRSREDARGVRSIFKGYFNSPQGSVSWQENRVTYRHT